MYKLTVVAGPNRGTSFALSDGTNSIGRQAGNAVVLNSSKVSKRHCVLVVSNGSLSVEDQGSSNGTFINGALTPNKKARPVKTGDRISVGEFVLQIVEPVSRPSNAPVILDMPGHGNLIRFPGQSHLPDLSSADGVSPGMGHSSPSGASAVPSNDPLATGAAMPKDLKGRALWYFENYVMPIFYNMMFKTEWRMLGIALFAALTVANLVVTVQPLMESNRQSLLRETARRARYMARQMADANAPFVAAKAETKTDVGSAEQAEGVRLAVLIDMDSRILAPGQRLNQYLTDGREAMLAIKARDLFRKGRETGVVEESGDLIVAVEPVKVFNSQLARNVVAAMSVVSVDSSLATPDMGEMGMVYSETLILTGLIGGLIFLILYRLSLKPYQVLADDMDKALKGESAQVTSEFKLEEMAPLWDLVNSALQRVSKSSASGGTGSISFDSGPSVDDFSGPVKMLATAAGLGIIIFDAERKISFINSLFEEISGVRSDNSIGQAINAVARDQSLGALTTDMFDRAPGGGEGVSEDYDFSGIGYKMYAAAFGTPGSIKGYVLAAMRTPD